MGCGSAVIAGEKVGFLGIALAFGLSVLVMVYAIGPISGCHINPAITVAMLAAGKIKAKDALGYIVAQFLGGIWARSSSSRSPSGRLGLLARDERARPERLRRPFPAGRIRSRLRPRGESS